MMRKNLGWASFVQAHQCLFYLILLSSKSALLFSAKTIVQIVCNNKIHLIFSKALLRHLF